MRHRGPDANAVHQISDTYFGHARLAIVDIAAGQQPMLSHDKKVMLTFNGEIYGYRELKKQYSYNYITESDTEVILAMYQLMGTKMLDRLPGMFAFAIWDDHNQSLFCARDRFGEKPLYYAEASDGSFLFASEIKTILASDLVEPLVRKERIVSYLKQSYVGADQTIYENIHVLPPGHFLIFKDGSYDICKYWHFPEVQSKISPSEAVENVNHLLRKAVGKQLIADVPIAGFLSSGLDSTTIMALAADQNKAIKTYSFDFGRVNSESKIAARSAKKYGLDFQEIRIDNFDLVETLVDTLAIYDEPFADSSAIPTYLICKEASRFTKVALTGDGGDELLGGYDFFYKPLLAFRQAKWLSNHEEIVLQLARLFWKLRLRNISSRCFNLFDAIKIGQNASSYEEVLRVRRSFFTDREITKLTGAEYVSPNIKTRLFEPSNSITDGLNYDIESYMAGDILVKTDRSSMAHGLELRSPFLDVDFATFALSLPIALKLSYTESKIVLRKAFQDVWIEEVRRNIKMGFESPLEEWLLRPDFKELIKEYLDDKSLTIYDILSFEVVKKYMLGSPQKLYILLVLSIWLQKNKIRLCG